MVPLKYLSNIYRTLKMPLISCEINLILTWSKICDKASNTAANQETTFAITDTRLYVLVVTLSGQDNEKLFQQLKSSFKRTIKWNKYQSKVTIQARNPYLDLLIDPSFKGVSKFFYRLKIKTIEQYTQNIIFQLDNVMIDG